MMSKLIPRTLAVVFAALLLLAIVTWVSLESGGGVAAVAAPSAAACAPSSSNPMVEGSDRVRASSQYQLESRRYRLRL
jgi:hypothetical protein